MLIDRTEGVTYASVTASYWWQINEILSDVPEEVVHKGVKIAELYEKSLEEIRQDRSTDRVNDNTMQPNKHDTYALLNSLILFSWANGFATYMNSTLLTNVTSLFDTTNLISILDTVLTILQAVLYPIFSKLSDMYGRAYLYTAAVILYMVSYVVFACSHSYQDLVGGRIIYAFGYTGVGILAPITIADITSVVDRGFIQAMYNLPTILNLYTASKAADAMWYSGNWRWGYGMIPLLLLVTCCPLIFTLWKLYFQVKKDEEMIKYREEKRRIRKLENKSLFERFVFVCEEIDLVGSSLMVAGLCLILLPLVLALSTFGGWNTAKTVGTLMGGVIAWIFLVIWEWQYAKKPIVPLTKWDTKTPIFGVVALSIVTVISSTNWLYFYTYLRVSRKASASTVTYLDSGYSVAYTICEITVGYLMKRYRVWRPFVWAGVSLMILGVGLMIPARLPTSSNAFVVISQAIAGGGSGFLYTPMLVAIQSSVPFNDMAIATALMQVGGAVAGSIGSTMAGSIWNNMLPGQIAKYVPGDYDYAKIVGDIDYAINLPQDQYDGVVQAYGHIQMVLSIIAICLAFLTFCFTLPMKGFGLEDNKPHHEQNNERGELEHSAAMEKDGSLYHNPSEIPHAESQTKA